LVTQDQPLETQIDVLKTIGLLAVILAHIETPNWVFQLRTFDVPLLVFVSGILFGMHQLHRPFELREYLVHRATRIILPVWLFMVMYFLLVAGWSQISGQKYPYSAQTILLEFVLISHVIGTWIFRVFLIVAMLSPLLLVMHKSLMTIKRFVLVLLSVFVIYQIVAFALHEYSAMLWYKVFENSILEAFPYFLLFGFGMIVLECDKNQRLKILTAAGVTFIALAITLMMTGQSIFLQDYKYPPSAFYMLYGVILSLVFFELSAFVRLDGHIFSASFKFMGRGSLWIYLWHWWYLYLLAELTVYFRPDFTIQSRWFLIYIGILSLSALTFYGQQRMANSIRSNPLIKNNLIARFVLRALSR